MVERLEEMKCSALMAVMLADLSRLGMTAADAGSMMSRMILERILGETIQHCYLLVCVGSTLGAVCLSVCLFVCFSAA